MRMRMHMMRMQMMRMRMMMRMLTIRRTQSITTTDADDISLIRAQKMCA
jgi:hypothetical protein